MALNSALEWIYFIECDSCRRRAPFGFHRYVAVFKARRAGFVRHEASEKVSIWLCRSCEKHHEAVEREKAMEREKAPLPPVVVTAPVRN